MNYDQVARTLREYRAKKVAELENIDSALKALNIKAQEPQVPAKRGAAKGWWQKLSPEQREAVTAKRLATREHRKQIQEQLAGA